MKKSLIIIICLLIPVVNILSGQEKAFPADRNEVQRVQNNPGSAPESLSESRKKPAFNKRRSNQPDPPKDLTGGLPSNVSPNQIKSFFSTPEEDNYIILNFDNADLKDVINTIGSITNENFIISPGVDARITIHSAKKIPVSEVFNVFESVLEVNGMALVRSGQFYKIIQGASAKQKPIEVRKGGEASIIPSVDRPVTQLVPVKYVPVTEISSVLTPMLSQFGSIIPNPRNSLLIINDLSSNLVRLLKVLKEIDVNAFKNTRMSFFKPRYSDVASLSNELTEVLNVLNLSREGVALVPIERINSLVVFSSSTTLLRTIEGWLKKLDEEVITGQNIYVYPIQNVKADSIADILRTLYETGAGTQRKKTVKRTQAVKKSKTSKRRTSRSTQTQTQAGGSRVEIITFEPSNSLVILAPPGIYREMVETIKRIDTYPREVLIEAVVAKVNISESDELGIRWSILQNLSGDLGDNVDGLFEGLHTSDGPLSSAPTLASGPSTGGFSFIMFEPGLFSAMLRAIASSTKVNILQSPRLLVRDQEEATIEVGKEIPTATSSTANTTTDTVTQNIEYKTVGIKLKIKPTINEEKTVVLDIEQEVSDVVADGRSVGGLNYPEFSTTQTKTSIVVPNEQGIIIGGIMEESTNVGSEGIPFLQSLPLIGNLFRYRTETLEKTELLIFIIPHVITSKVEGDRMTTDFLDKLGEVKEFLNEKQGVNKSAQKTGLVVPSK